MTCPTSQPNKYIKCVNNESHGFLLDKQGTVYCFGQNSTGQLGLNHSQSLSNLSPTPFLTNITDIATKS
jgi:alpha-tubulin suppressor-like RCC1 family protein